MKINKCVGKKFDHAYRLKVFNLDDNIGKKYGTRII